MGVVLLLLLLLLVMVVLLLLLLLLGTVLEFDGRSALMIKSRFELPELPFSSPRLIRVNNSKKKRKERERERECVCVRFDF